MNIGQTFNYLSKVQLTLVQHGTTTGYLHTKLTLVKHLTKTQPTLARHWTHIGLHTADAQDVGGGLSWLAGNDGGRLVSARL